MSLFYIKKIKQSNMIYFPQTRLHDWTAGGLSTVYFQEQLGVAQGLLEQYEQSAVPQGWACQWDRYAFNNHTTLLPPTHTPSSVSVNIELFLLATTQQRKRDMMICMAECAQASRFCFKDTPISNTYLTARPCK